MIQIRLEMHKTLLMLYASQAALPLHLSVVIVIVALSLNNY